MKCERFPSYQEFKSIVLSHKRDWLGELQEVVGGLPPEDIARCIEKLYSIPVSLFPKKVYIVVRYREVLLEIYDHLKEGKSLLSWVKDKKITYKTAEEILKTFGFTSVKELSKIPDREDLCMLPPKFVPWTNTPVVSSSTPQLLLKLITFRKDTWEKIERLAREKNITSSELVERIINQCLDRGL